MRNLLRSLRTALFFVVCMMASLAINAETFCVNGIYYEMYSWDEAIVVSSADGYSGNIIIPETVTTMVPTMYGEYEETLVVALIGENAFRDCNRLTSITMPNTIRSIGRNAFYGCTTLQNITLPSSLSLIGSSAFGYCTSFSSIVIPDGVRTIDWNAFYCCTGLTSVTIPNSVTQLNGTFFGCTGLTSIQLPQSLVSLDGTFTGCTGLTSIVVPASVDYIGARTFEGCTALKSVVLPASITNIAEQAFFNCENLMSVTCLAVSPPSMYTNNSECFDYSTYTNGRLYVPTASREQYESTEWWKLFKNIQGLLSLNKTSVTLEKGRTLQLVATFAPGFESELSWRSNNQNVVTVSADGKIKAISVGGAIVYAMAGEEQVACKVSVKAAGDHLLGDEDGDGEVTIADVVFLIDLIIDRDGVPVLHDVDGDGEVNIGDVVALIDIIMGNK